MKVRLIFLSTFEFFVLDFTRSNRSIDYNTFGVLHTLDFAIIVIIARLLVISLAELFCVSTAHANLKIHYNWNTFKYTWMFTLDEHPRNPGYNTPDLGVVLVSIKLANTVMDKSQTGCPILYCKRPILRVGAWPIWAGPAHSSLDQPTVYTSSFTHSKMSFFKWVLLKI